MTNLCYLFNFFGIFENTCLIPADCETPSWFGNIARNALVVCKLQETPYGLLNQAKSHFSLKKELIILSIVFISHYVIYSII